MRLWHIVVLLCWFNVHSQDGSWNINLLSHYSLSDASDIWGWEDTITGRRFAFVGGFSGTYIFDITDPKNPILIDTIPGGGSIWRDMKVWAERLYIVHDIVYSGSASGLQIVNLRVLADSNIVKYRNTFPGGFQNAHNIFIDERGRAWLWGSTPGNNYVIDLTNPDTPVFITDYAIGGGINPYIHDGFVRNNTVWGSHIYEGKVGTSLFDEGTNTFSFISAVSTPGQFTHNVWITDNGKYMFTTDETSGSPIGIFDISNPNTPLLIATFRSSRNSVIPHNVFYKDGFIYISYYTDGVVVADVRVPDLPVEVAWYDTSPFNTAEFKGCWGVFPFFRDNIIIASDMKEGLFVLEPAWKPAVRLYVRIFEDSTKTTPVGGVQVRILSPGQTYADGVTNLAGVFKAGFTDSGEYKITVSLPDTFYSDTVSLAYGETDTIDFIVGKVVSSEVPNNYILFNECIISSEMIRCKKQQNIKFFSIDGKLIRALSGREVPIPHNTMFICIGNRCNKIAKSSVY